MGCPDVLSHRSNPGVGSKNLDVTLLVWVMEGTIINRPEVPLLCDVWKVFTTEPELEDPVALVAWELLKNRKAASPRSAEWQISDRLLLFHGKIVMLQNEDLHHRIMEQHHDTQVTGHAGHFKMLELISWNCWLPQFS
jgi:hypothetical protein